MPRITTRTLSVPPAAVAWSRIAALALAGTLLLSGALGAQARPGDVDALITRAATTYNAARTATAKFEQTITNPLTGSTSVSRGEFQRQAPDRYNFSFTDPRGDRIVADGSFLWIYTPSSNPRQVLKLPQTAAGAGMADLGAQFFHEPRRRFTIGDGGTATVSGRATRMLTLTPRTGDAAFTRATVWLDPADGTLRQFETTDGMGVKRRVLITDVKVNVPVKAEQFSFRPPAGVRVVDQAQLSGAAARR